MMRLTEAEHDYVSMAAAAASLLTQLEWRGLRFLIQFVEAEARLETLKDVLRVIR